MAKIRNQLNYVVGSWPKTQINLISLKNSLYLFRETCSSISLKGSQLPWQTDPYPFSRLGWIIWNKHIFSPIYTTVHQSRWSLMAGLPGQSEPWHLQWHCCFISCVTFAVIKIAAGQHFLGDLPWGWTSLPISNCHSSIWKKSTRPCELACFAF